MQSFDVSPSVRQSGQPKLDIMGQRARTIPTAPELQGPKVLVYKEVPYCAPAAKRGESIW